MTNPFFLIMNCEFEDKGDEVLVYWKWTPDTLIFTPKNHTYTAGKHVWCLKDDLERLKQQGAPIKKAAADSTEFFYRTQDLIDLKGVHFKKIRNKINAFHKKHPFTLHENCEAEEAKTLIRDWHKKAVLKKNEYNKSTVDFEVESALSMIDLLPSLPQVQQLAVRIEGKLVGYTLFCPLYDDAWVSIIQKTDYKYRNLAKFMYHEKCKRMAKYAHVSFGDDGKDASLAAAKMELQPIRTEVAYMVDVA